MTGLAVVSAFRRTLSVGAVACFLAFLGSARADLVFTDGDEWQYFKGRSEASPADPGAWREPGFDASAWLTGAAPFFYEDSSGYQGETRLTDMRGGYGSLFLRKRFDIANPRDAGELTLNVRCDDGCVAWINGIEVGRVNVRDGEPAFNWTSINAQNEPNVLDVTIDDPAAVLIEGSNVVAIHAFNASLGGSSDFLVAARLNTTLDTTPPEIVGVSPVPFGFVSELSTIVVTFSESVTGVDPDDLLINDSPATAVETVSPREYSFEFAQPANGAVTVTWVENHGITDLAGAANEFRGDAWSYTLDPNASASRVIISEILARNENGERDEDGERSDWIELLNLGPQSVNLDGWQLTDDPVTGVPWILPAITLEPNGYLVIWASGKNRSDATRELHTDFRLNQDGEPLSLLDTEGTVVSAFEPAFPPQRPDISYGRDRVDPGFAGFIATPTPGRPNAVGGPGFAPDPEFSIPGGFLDVSRWVVELSAPRGEIRYTTNGSSPTQGSSLYTGPIVLTDSTVIQARVFEPGLLPGRIVARAFYRLSSGVRSFSSNLPLMILSTSRRGIQQDNRIPAHATVIDTYRGRAGFTTPPTLESMASIEIRGQSSSGFPKKQYNLEITDTLGNDLEVPLLGLPAESDWVLNGPYSDKSLLNNFLAYELHEQMGHYAVRRRFVEVFIDTRGRQLEFPRDYVGVYVLLEKIKIDNNRVDVARLHPGSDSEPGISGGYIIKKDKSSPGDRSFSTRGGAGFGGQSLKYHDPKPREITPAQEAWIRDYLNSFEQALYAPGWLTARGPNHYSQYIDVDSFVDNHWIVEFAKQIDGYRISNYMTKERGGRLKMEPIWDWNLSFGNANYYTGETPSGWYFTLTGANEHIWLRRLISGSPSAGTAGGDPDFNQRIIDRWNELRGDILNGDRVAARIDELADGLAEAAGREARRWNHWNQYVWPNPNFFVAPTYREIIEAKKQFVRNRFAWIDTQFIAAPTFNRAGGPVPAGFELEVPVRREAVFVTFDGTDPRAPGGGVQPGAFEVTGPIAIEQNVKVVARAKRGTRWSGQTAATFVVSIPALVLTEIMYHPAAPPIGSRHGESDYEFVELRNVGSQTLNLAGFRFVSGIQFEFSQMTGPGPGPVLLPGESIVIVANQAAFVERYGSLEDRNVAGEFAGNLANEGERLALEGSMGERVFDIRYDGTGHPATDGLGFALVAVNPSAAVSPPASPSAFIGRTGTSLLGTPGLDEEDAPETPVIVINEILSNPVPPALDAIELHNPNTHPVDVSGWFLSDDPVQPKFSMPPLSVIPPGGYLVIEADQFGAAIQNAPGFGLRSSGDEAYLFSADDMGRLTGYVHGFEFGATQPGVTIGRHRTESGAEHWVPQRSPTIGFENSGPSIGPIVISEIHYRPPDVPANGGQWNNWEDEFVELHNLSDRAVALHDDQTPANTWRLRDGVNFSFPDGLSLAPDERIVVVGWDPIQFPERLDGFRNRFAIDPATRVFGPFNGALANASDFVELVMPVPIGLADGEPGTAEMPTDAVRYRDESPWPVGADGVGFSLQRAPESAYGDDPYHWIAAAPTPGTGLSRAEPVRILAQSGFGVFEAGKPVSMTVEASGPEPLTYQWRRDGVNLVGATGATLVLDRATPAMSGQYQVVVHSADRATESDPISVTVVPPDADSDADGLPDFFELIHRLGPLNPNDADDDADNDRFSNRDEFAAGTDASDPSSFLQIDALAVGDTVAIRFQALANRAYTVLHRDDTGGTGGQWSVLAEIPVESPDSNDVREVIVHDDESPRPVRRYYRLQVR